MPASVITYLFIYLNIFIQHFHGLGPQQDSEESLRSKTGEVLSAMNLTFSWGKPMIDKCRQKVMLDHDRYYEKNKQVRDKSAIEKSCKYIQKE